ncbi:MAG: cupin domain-containing protein [Terriglobia bacterium]
MEPGAKLPPYTVSYDETSTLIRGKLTYVLATNQYDLKPLSTAFVPQGMTRQWVNQGNEVAEVIWVYAGEKSERKSVNPDS